MNPFTVLGVEPRFDIDLAVVEKNHRELSRALHPDRFSGAAPSERRMALAKAVEVNEAWRIVRDPIRRAEALFSLANIPVGETSEPKPSPAFLMEVLDEREALGEARDAQDLETARRLEQKVRVRAEQAQGTLRKGFLEAGLEREKLIPLLRTLGELRFFRRFLDEVSAIEEELDA